MRRSYAPVADSCRAARDDLHAFLLPYGFDDNLIQDLLLVVNELVANAIDHARTPFSVIVALTERAIRIQVQDGSASRRACNRATRPLPGDTGCASSMLSRQPGASPGP